MRSEAIKFIDSQLRLVPGLTDLFRQRIVDALREGQAYKDIWCELYDLVTERKEIASFEIPDEIRGCDNLTIIRYLMEKMHERYLHRETPVHEKSVLDATIDNLAWRYIKDLVKATFDKVDKILEKQEQEYDEAHCYKLDKIVGQLIQQ